MTRRKPQLYDNIVWHLGKRGTLASRDLAQLCKVSAKAVAARCAILAAQRRIIRHIVPMPGPRILWSLPGAQTPERPDDHPNQSNVLSITADDLAWMARWKKENRAERRAQGIHP